MPRRNEIPSTVSAPRRAGQFGFTATTPDDQPVDPLGPVESAIVLLDRSLRCLQSVALSGNPIRPTLRQLVASVARYDAAGGGFCEPHRDNTTKGTAHRRFAVTLNLNAESHEGGDLRLPEFGPQSWRAPTGGAVVFSCSLLHEVLPVTKGTRYAYLPFLYGEEDARRRGENRRFVAKEHGGSAAEPQSAA